MTPAPAAQERNISIAAEDKKCLNKNLLTIQSFFNVPQLYGIELKLEQEQTLIFLP
jgi:hypothetical protein